jgi:hypothetical protein
MNTRTIAWSVAALVLAIASGAGAQPLPVPEEAPAAAAPPRAAQPQPNALAAAEIVASVRSAGFDPLSRPVRRGSIYVVFARDRYLMDVQVRVDARSGRVLAATRLAGVAFGGPGYEAYDRRRYEPAPVPPGEIPLQPPLQQSRRLPGPVAIGGGRRPAERSGEQPAPLPRARPDEVVTGDVKEAAPPVRTDPPAANPPAAAASPKPPPSPPPQPVMVPVAPLE